MSRTVYKFRLYPSTPCVVQMPRFAQVLHVGSQDDGPTLWAEVDTAQPPEDRTFFVYGTGGWIAEEGLRYVGTTQTDAGFVWHIYERPIERNLGDLILEMAGSGGGNPPR